MLAPVDYDNGQHKNYSVGRELSSSALARWEAAFATWAPARRPLACLDLGSGTGRFTPLLADLFGGPVFGIEPSAKMRAVAEAGPHPATVRYLAGSAEHIPLRDSSCDLVLMFLSFHHVRDRAAAAAEIGRVLAPGGRVLIRSVFADRMPDLDWHRYFRRARAIELEMFPTTTEVKAIFAAEGLQPVALHTVRVTLAANLAESARKLRTRSISTFEHLTEAEIEEGFRLLDAAVANDSGAPIEGDSDVLVLERSVG